MLTSKNSPVLVSLVWWLRRSLDAEGIKIKIWVDLLVILFISIPCAWVGVLRTDNVDVSDGEAEWVSWCIVSG